MAGRRRRGGGASPPEADGAACGVCLCAAGDVRLPCGHRFCAPCVRRTAREAALRCPLCRRRYAAWLRRHFPDYMCPSPPTAPLENSPPDLRRPSPVPVPLARPGEIGLEFRLEMERLRIERRRLDAERSRHSEKLILELRLRGEIFEPSSPELVPPAFGRRRAPDEGRDSLQRELCHFKPVHPVSLTRYDARLVRTPTFVAANGQPPSVDFDTFDPVRSLSKLGLDAAKPIRSAFVCLARVAVSVAKSNLDRTPKKTDGKSSKASLQSQSCSKLNGVRPDLRFSKRLRRLSLGDVDERRDTSGATPKSPIETDGKARNGTDHRVNGETTLRPRKNGLCNGAKLDVDLSTVARQKKIERMIDQEKNDFELAKKLQRQLNGAAYTGYTVRTAAKRQSTLTELLPPSKHMKT